jgi:hypothetical protein
VSQKRSWGYRGGPGVTAGDVTEDQGSRGLVSQTSWCHKELVSQNGSWCHRGGLGITEELGSQRRTWGHRGPGPRLQAMVDRREPARTTQLSQRSCCARNSGGHTAAAVGWWPMVAYGGRGPSSGVAPSVSFAWPALGSLSPTPSAPPRGHHSWEDPASPSCVTLGHWLTSLIPGPGHPAP